MHLSCYTCLIARGDDSPGWDWEEDRCNQTYRAQQLAEKSGATLAKQTYNTWVFERLWKKSAVFFQKSREIAEILGAGHC